MKTTFAVALLGLLPAVLGQTAAPSPTESVGCHSHGHCEGPRTTLAAVSASVSDLWEHGDSSTTITTVAGTAETSVATTEVHEHDHEEHTDATGTKSLAPSPTESTGHCTGPATADTAAHTTTSNPAATISASTAEITNGAGLEMVPVAGMLVAAILAY
ncbi:hypothetical protein G7046_g7082 [Stylonectria norvegica]|nr:hypothetical protein G7046_g7082 [Stylonectria norvegica]